jgi:nitric oxide reductase subunit C
MALRSLFLLLVLGLLLAACGGGGGQQAASAVSGNADNGQKLFNSGKGSAPACSACHSVKPNEKLVGPSLAGIATRAGQTVKDPSYKGQAKDTVGYVRESIVDPNVYVVPSYPANVMYPNFSKDLTSQEVDDLVAYLMTLK